MPPSALDAWPATATAVRALAMDAVQRAGSGHPGAPMGMADMACSLWGAHLKHNPAHPAWFDRDRVVLSNGHAAMLLYAVLHLTGYELSIDDLKAYRTLGSRTPGHPEVHVTPGVETTTGPLGQGLANAVGMALAEKLLALHFNRPAYTVVDHRTYVFVGDGCLMEGISHEAASLAGVWKLNKLIALYDDNGISIDGPVAGWFADDTPQRFRAYGWNVIGPIDGHDAHAVSAAIDAAKVSTGGPSLIVCRTTIGKGAPNRQGTSRAHGEPLGDEEVQRARASLDWPWPPFEVPGDVQQAWNARAAGLAAEADWTRRFEAYAQAHPALAAELRRRIDGRLHEATEDLCATHLLASHKAGISCASRKASQLALDVLTARIPELLGGSADLTGSNLTQTAHLSALQDGASSAARYVHYGVREFGMAAILNGIALHGGFIPYGGTFLTFSDYSRNALRMAALMQLRVVHVFTHDSIGVGEDGPTHQPIEHAASLRLIPNLDVWRPADTCETFAAWTVALSSNSRPTALLLSRQSLPYLPKRNSRAPLQGGYVLSEVAGEANGIPPAVVILATGSEVQLALQAQERLAAEGVAARVVSMPSTTVFDRQPVAYREQVLPGGVPRIAVEAGATAGWFAYGCSVVVGIDRFGECGSASEVFRRLGVTVDAVVTAARSAVASRRTA